MRVYVSNRESESTAKSRARLLEEGGRGQESATSDRLDCPHLFVTCPLPTPLQSDRNLGSESLLLHFNGGPCICQPSE